MFERFSEKAIRVIMLAQEESRRLCHNFVGDEQILLGLIGEGTGIAAKALKSNGVTLRQARVEAEKIIGRGTTDFVAVEIPFTPSAKRLLELSWDEARQLGHNYVGTEHLLLGILGKGEGIAVAVLRNIGVDLARVKSHVVRLLGESGASSVERSLVEAVRVRRSQSELPSIDKFADSAMKAILVAREETRRLGQKEVSPQSILLGILADEGSLAARALQDEGVTLEVARRGVETIVGRGSGVISVDCPFSEATHELFKIAWAAVRGQSRDCLSSEHLLFGLVQLENCGGGGLLRKLGAEPSRLMATITKELQKGTTIVKSEPFRQSITEMINPQRKAQDPLPDPFSRFTEKAIKVIMFAQEEARLVGHNFVGTETILLGLIRESAGIGALALKSQGVDLENARIEVEKIIGRGSEVVTAEVPFTPGGKRTIAHAWDEARGLGHMYIGTEHLLLGLLDDRPGTAARVLENLDVEMAKLRAKVIELLKEGGAATA